MYVGTDEAKILDPPRQTTFFPETWHYSRSHRELVLGSTEVFSAGQKNRIGATDSFASVLPRFMWRTAKPKKSIVCYSTEFLEDREVCNPWIIDIQCPRIVRGAQGRPDPYPSLVTDPLRRRLSWEQA